MRDFLHLRVTMPFRAWRHVGVVQAASARLPLVVRRAFNMVPGTELHVLPTSAYASRDGAAFAVSVNHPGLDRPLLMPEEWRVAILYVERLQAQGLLAPLEGAPAAVDHHRVEDALKRAKLPPGTPLLASLEPIPEWTMVERALSEEFEEAAPVLPSIEGRMSVSARFAVGDVDVQVLVHRDGVVEAFLPGDVPDAAFPSFALVPTLDGTGRRKAVLDYPPSREELFRVLCLELRQHAMDQVAARFGG